MIKVRPAFICSLPNASGSFDRQSIKVDPENNGDYGFKQYPYHNRVYKFYHYKSSLWGGIENSSDKSLVGIVLMDLNNRSKTKPDLIWLWTGESCICKCLHHIVDHHTFPCANKEKYYHCDECDCNEFRPITTKYGSYVETDLLN